MAIPLQIMEMEVVTLVTNLIIDYTPVNLPVSNIAPFTQKDGENYLSELHRLEHFVNANLVGEVNTQLNAVISQVTTAINAEQTENTTSIQNLIDFVNETVTALTGAELEDATITSTINNATSTSRAAFNALYALTDAKLAAAVLTGTTKTELDTAYAPTDAKLAAAVVTGTTQTALNAAYAPHSTVSATDAVIAALVVAGTTKTALDAAYAPHSSVSMTDAGIEAIVANVASLTRIYLATVFAPIATVSATDTAIQSIVANNASATHAYLVANFAPGSTVSMTDAGIQTILANGASAAHAYLVANFAPASTISATDANIDHAIITAGTATRGSLDALYGIAPSTQNSVSVKAYGAVGDGATDDTTAIQAAVNSNPIGTIFFPKGNYLVSGLITVPTSLRLVGVSGSQSVIITNSATLGILFLNSACVVEELGFSSSVAVTANAFISAQGNNIYIKNCRFSNHFGGVLIGADGSGVVSGVMVDQCLFLNGATAVNGYGIRLINHLNTIISNCEIIGPSTGTQPKLGIYIDYGNNLNINNVIIQYITTAVLFITSTQAMRGVKISNSHFSDGTGSGVLFSSGNSYPFYDILFSNCEFSRFSADGAQLAANAFLDGVTFTGCAFYSNVNGIHIPVSAFVKNITINGCMFAANSTAGIYIQSVTILMTIIANRIGAIAGLAGNATGILLAAVANTQYVLIGNHVLGNTTAQITDSSTGTPDRANLSTTNLTA